MTNRDLLRVLLCGVCTWLSSASLSLAEHAGKVQILLLGDSTTEGIIPRRHVPQGPHLEDVIRGLLAEERDLPPTNVINLGLSGEYIQRLLDSGRYDKEAAKLPGIDYILIRYGLNDMARRENFEENFPKDYHQLIERLKHDHPQAQQIVMTVIPYGDEERCHKINRLNEAVAKAEGLPLFDIFPRYAEELKQGPNMLNYRRFPLDQIPENRREFVKPFVVDGRTVEVLDNRLDSHFGHLPGWYGDRHPNLAGYHVIGDETAKYLAPMIRERHMPQKIDLWNGKAPLGNGQTEEQNVSVSIHRPAHPSGTAVVICPGGGYSGLVTEPEGHGIARWLNRVGVTGIVLEYRMPSGRHAVPLLDVQRAIRSVRTNASNWQIAPDRIGVMGFSAGGHLASTVATHFDLGQADAADPIDKASCRPDFAILVYPVITMGEKTHGGSKQNLLGPNPSAELMEQYSNEMHVTAQTCPTFLAHALDDTAVIPENSQVFYEALKKHGVPGKYLELPSGGHGLNGYQGPSWEAWQAQSVDWLRELKFLPSVISKPANE